MRSPQTKEQWDRVRGWPELDTVPGCPAEVCREKGERKAPALLRQH